MLQSGKTLVRQVSEARERKLRQMVRRFQGEPDAIQSHKQWKEIEKEVFGVDYPMKRPERGARTSVRSSCQVMAPYRRHF